MTMQGKTVLVTGATNGIGEVTALELARMGAHVVLVSRSAERCQASVDKIRTATGSSAVEYIAADLSELAGVHQAAEEFLARHQALDVLVNNAGAYFNERRLSRNGYEMTFALNHLSYFLLTHLLLDALHAAGSVNGEARIVNVSSDAHKVGALNFDDMLRREKKYSGFGVYGESKLMNVMFTYALARRLENSTVTANVLHPGFVRTGFGRNNGGLLNTVFGFLQIFALTPEQGAETNIHLASSPEVKGISGQYFTKKRAVESSSASYDRAAQERLWQLSAEITGVGQPALA